MFNFKKMFLIICVLTCCLTLLNNAKAYSDQNDSSWQSEYTKEIGSSNEIDKSTGVSFIYVPAKNDYLIPNYICTAMIAAKEALEEKGTSVKLYTLHYSSQEHAAISMTTTLPAILVVNRTCQNNRYSYMEYQVVSTGKYYVNGQITKSTLLQGVIEAAKDGQRLNQPKY